MHKSIIPELVSFDTDLYKIPGFVMCQNFDFFKGVKQKSKFHYKIVLCDDIDIPTDYEFRSEYYTKKDNFWYYERKIFFWHPKFKYDYKNKIFYFNRSYYRLPISLGGMFTIGEHIANTIELDIFLSGHVILRGIAARVNNKNVGISAPGFNGKTTLLKRLLKQGASYIAEDYLILDLAEKKVYPTCPLVKENFWRRRKISNELENLLHQTDVLKTPVLLDDLYLVQNSQNSSSKTEDRKFIDFLLLNSLYYLNNLLVRSFIYEQDLTNIVFDRIQELKKININYTFVGVNNLHFNFL